MTRIACDCKTCLSNNGGQPLYALVPDTLPKAVYSGRKGRHSVVYDANNPSALGAAVRAVLGIKAG